MTALAIVFFVLAGLALINLTIAAIRLDMHVRNARLRLGVLTGGLSEARALSAARARLRARQKRVQDAVESGTVGIEAAHRVLSSYFGEGSGYRQETGYNGRFYERLRGINRGVGQALSGWLAPRKHRRRETLAQRHERNGGSGDDD